MTRERLILVLAIGILAGVFLADAVLTPESLLPSLLYAVPIVITGYFLSARTVVLVSILTWVLFTVATVLMTN